MSDEDKTNFTFVSNAPALAENTFEVVSFTGTEAISRPYEFAITLSAEDADIDLKAVLSDRVTLTIVHGDEEIPIHGVLSVFEQLHEANQRIFYRAVLVPKLWYLGMNRVSRVYLDKKVPDIIKDVLDRSHLTYEIPDWSTSTTYVKREYVCQYQESDLAFISRWMEREGIYYFFEQTSGGEKMIITDNKARHNDIQGGALPYSPDSGLIPSNADVVNSFICRQQVLPKSVVLRDYDYLNPRVSVQSDPQTIVDSGQGEIYIYGEDFNDHDQGNTLAKIRAQEQSCRETAFYGKASAPTLSSGFLFTLEGHFRSSCNGKYLITEAAHRGSQTGMLLTGTEGAGAASDVIPGYSNQFTCIPADLQFRPERKTPRPVVRGSQTAVVVGPTGTEGPYTEAYGRVKVQFHWDREGQQNEHSSAWIRVSQVWAGAGWGGFHLPHVGQEVIVGFIEGDPDRPIIMGRVYNGANKPGLHTGTLDLPTDKLKSIIRDDGGNEIVFDSNPDDPRISIYNPKGETVIQANKNHTYWSSHTDAGELFTGAKVSVLGGLKSEAFLGSSSSVMAGFSAEFKLSAAMEAVVGVSSKLRVGPEYQISSNDKVTVSEEDWMQIAQGDAIIDSHGDKDGKVILIGGPARESMMEMGKAGVTLSIGTLPRESDSARKIMEGIMIGSVVIAGLAHLGNAITAIGNYAGMAADETWAENKADTLGLNTSIGVHVVSVAAGIVANVLALVMYKKQLKPDKVKEELKLRPIQSKIEMKSWGAISIDTVVSGRSIHLNAGGGTIRLESTDQVLLQTPLVNARHGLKTANIADLG